MDRTIICLTCGGAFLYSAQRQADFARRGFRDPKRCARCGVRKKVERGDLFDGGPCRECGRPAILPFEPTGTRAVFCRRCYIALGFANTKAAP